MRDPRTGSLPPTIRELLRWAGGLADPPASDRLVAKELKRHGLLGLVGSLPDQHRVPGDVLAAATTMQQISVAIEARAIWVMSLLADAGVETRVLKGLATASLDYPERERRTFNDVDLLVRPDSLGIAAAVLAEAGLEREIAEPFNGFDRRFSKGVTMAFPDGLEVDLHRTFVLGAIGLRIPLEELWADSAVFELGGREVRALAASHRFMNTAIHSAMSPLFRGNELLDLRVIAMANQLAPADLLDVAGRWRVLTPMAVAVRIAAGNLGDDWLGAELSSWARSYRPSRLDRWLVDAHIGPRASTAKRTIGALTAMKSRDRAAYVTGYVVRLTPKRNRP
jgi:hypothetical protein